MPRVPCKKKTPRTRRGGAPTDSATCWTVGSEKRGADGSMYVVVPHGSSRRWSRTNSTSKTKSMSRTKSKTNTSKTKSRKVPKQHGGDQSTYNYSIEYAPTGRAKCKHSGNYIKEGQLRIGRFGKNTFAGDGAQYNTLGGYYHVTHAWPTFLRSRCSTNVPLKPEDLRGFSKLTASDKTKIRSAIKSFAQKWNEKCLRQKK